MEVRGRESVFMKWRERERESADVVLKNDFGQKQENERVIFFVLSSLPSFLSVCVHICNVMLCVFCDPQLLDAVRISKYTSKKCDLSRGVGAQFSLLDGLILGTQEQSIRHVNLVFHFIFWINLFLSFSICPFYVTSF